MFNSRSKNHDSRGFKNTFGNSRNGFASSTGNGDRFFVSSTVCFKCGKSGHFAKECYSEDDKGGFKKDNPENYIPPEILDETLFDHGINTGINFEKYRDIPVKVTGQQPPEPIKAFEDCGLRRVLLENVKKSRYVDPTPVQKYALPIVKSGRDMMACAQTGSGKTAAFLLPMLHALLEESIEPHMGHPQTPEILIITPTRELTIQIAKEAKKFALNCNIGVMALYGGTNVNYQFDLLRERNVNVIVATPGRLLQSVREKVVSLKDIRFLVLDEADRMLDMGFQGDIDEIVRDPVMPLKSNRQTLMFSATFPIDIQQAAATYLKEDYLFLEVGIVGGACVDVTQALFEVPQFDKREKLQSLLQKAQISPGKTEKTLVFVEKKQSADFIASLLCEESFLATSIHGDRKQSQREEAVRDFTAGRMTILVATAVAARGLDIPNVTHVINYDLPSSIDEYVHRIGRTGRVGNIGKATSFYDTNVDQPLSRDLVKILSQAQQTVPDWLRKEAERAVGSCLAGSYGGGFGNFVTSDIRQQPNVAIASKPYEVDDDDWD